MIGDFVRIVAQPSFNYYEYKPIELVRVKEILYTGINPDWCGAEVNGIIPFEDIEPIVLTQEILEKNGFVYAKPHLSTLSEEKVWQIENTDTQVLVELEAQTDDNLIEYYVGNFIRGANSVTLYFIYVHQLQHAMRLCGIDKDIEARFFE